MVGVVVVSHADLAASLCRAAEMLLGRQDGLRAVGLGDATRSDALRTALEQAIAAVDAGAGVLVLADLYGGSPEAVAAEVASDAGCPVELVAGANLPLVIAALTQRERLPLSQLAAHVRKAGREGVVHVPVAGRWPPAAHAPG